MAALLPGGLEGIPLRWRADNFFKIPTHLYGFAVIRQLEVGDAVRSVNSSDLSLFIMMLRNTAGSTSRKPRLHRLFLKQFSQFVASFFAVVVGDSISNIFLILEQTLCSRVLVGLTRNCGGRVVTRPKDMV
jgi:hypothetical protein